MKVTAKTIAPCQQQLEIVLSAEAVAQAYDAVYRDIQREAVLPGFRKGKAPRDLLEKHHGQAAKEEVLKRLIGDAIHQATEERQWQLVGRCDVSAVQLDQAKGLQFVAEIEIAPEFALGAYTGLVLQRPSADVTDADVNQVLSSLQEHHAQMVPTGSGEEKQKQLPALDDAFAKDIGFESLESLRKRVRLDAATQRQEEGRRALEQQLYDALLTQVRFDVPPSLVERQAERLKRNLAARLLMQGMTEEQAKQEMAKFEQELAVNAQRQVKLRFVLDRIAQEERISVAQEDLVRHLWALANRTRQDPNALRRQLDEQGLWEAVAAEVRYEKTVDFLFKAAKITEAAQPASAPPVVTPA